MLTFQIIIGIVVLLALTDLVVGVSNDAVNFLNSAVGSQAASFRTILIIASVGVVVGTLFSNGMMQIARNGVFQPEFFTFDKVMIIFLAVMLTDVILLDVYNTFGLPTSTTVSLIFELLGASFAVGVLMLFTQGKALAELENILNYRSAVVIIGGIFFSVLVAFVSGTVIHFFTRLLFTFRVKKSLYLFGPPFTGVAVTVIIYFLLIKGLEGSAFASASQLNWISGHSISILISCFIVITVLTVILMRLTTFNPLRLVVLLGTFSLAMAFAGNDLVNFIGVSVAGYSAYEAWANSGIAAEAFNMSALNENIRTPIWFLLAAGVIMILTLWFSAKSRKVTETEVTLGQQAEGEERFGSSILSRWIVGGAVSTGSLVLAWFPTKWMRVLEKRLEQPKPKEVKTSQPSFDLLRASVNLVVSSALIAYGTSNRLPLSTTFVTFMVAMGTSFADQAWGRESAVYRVSGVLQVISGWLLTAVVAFLGSALVALFLYFTGFWGILIVSCIAFGLIIYSQVSFKKKLEAEKDTDELSANETITVRQLLDQSKLKTSENLQHISRLLSLCFLTLKEEKPTDLDKQKKQVKKIEAENKRLSSKIVKYIRKTENRGVRAGRLNLMVFDLMQDMYQSSFLISDVCSDHISNFHALPSKYFQEVIKEMDEKTKHFLGSVGNSIQQHNLRSSEEVVIAYHELSRFLTDSLDRDIELIQHNKLPNRLAILQTRILLEMTDIIETSYRLYQLYRDFTTSIKDENIHT